MTTLVVASNLSGGIARHLAITSEVVPVRVVELPETLNLLDKIRRVRKLLLEEQVTRVVTHGVAAGLAVRLRGPGLGGVVHVEFWHGDPFFGAWRRRAVFRALALAGRLPVEQVFTHAWLRDEYAARGSHARVLSNAVPSADSPRAPAAMSPRRAVYLGRLSPEKGFEDLISAWPDGSADRDWFLHVYGDGPLEMESVPGVVMGGYTATPAERIAEAQLVVIPSWTETGPYVALEAAAMGRPFVGTAVGDMPEMVDKGACGWLVEPRDVAALRATLETVQALSAGELAAYGARGQQWLEQSRPFASWAAEVQTIYVPSEVGTKGADALVVVPTLGRRFDYLVETLDSLQAQHEAVVRVIVVAPDGAAAVAAECARRGIEFLTQTGRGMSQAINQGWSHAGDSEEFWSWLGDDDLLSATSVSAAVAALRSDRQAVMAYGRCAYIRANGDVLFEARPGRWASWLLRWGPDLVAQPGSLARADAVRRVGMLDESLRYAMDLDLFLRLKDVGGLVYLPTRLAAFRWHEGSTTVAAPGASDAEARSVRQRSWVGRRRIGQLLERPAHEAGRFLNRLQRRRVAA